MKGLKPKEKKVQEPDEFDRLVAARAQKKKKQAKVDADLKKQADATHDSVVTQSDTKKGEEYTDRALKTNKSAMVLVKNQKFFEPEHDFS